MTQVNLARSVGCAEITIQKIEADERRPSAQIAALLAEQLQIPPDERAARLWGSAERLRTTLGCRPAPAARATYERALAIARAQLGGEAFAAAWAAGEALSLDAVIAEMLGSGD